MNNEYYCGLNNHGNTCFFNSAIQSIMRCSVFITFISNLRIDSELINIFQEFIKEYKQNSGKVTSPIKLVKYYSIRNPNYSIGDQDDSDEVLNILIQDIDEIIQKEIKEKRIENITIKGDIRLNKMIEYLFGVIIETTIKCLKCNSRTFKKITEYKICVPIKANNLLENLENYKVIEELKGDEQYYCEKCKTKVDALKSDQIIKTPKYLHIQLKRFINNGRRISKIGDTVSVLSNIEIAGNKYNLRGSIHHMGSYNGGHYIYHYNKNKNNSFDDWICLDDSSISNKNVNNDINQGYVYLFVK